MYDKARVLAPETRRVWHDLLSVHIGRAAVSLIIDLSCGTGRFSELLAGHFSAQVIGIDPSLKMLDQARRNPAIGNVVYCQGLAEVWACLSWSSASSGLSVASAGGSCGKTRTKRTPVRWAITKLTDRKWGDGMTLMTAAAITALLSMSAAQAQEGPYLSEQAARTCIQNRLAELLAERNPNIAADAPLTTCTNDLKAEFKAKGKSYCEAIGYIAWLVADENSKRNGVTGQPYSADKSFLQHCARSETWDRHR